MNGYFFKKVFIKEDIVRIKHCSSLMCLCGLKIIKR